MAKIAATGLVVMLHRLGVNRSVFYSLLARGAQSAAALVSIAFVARFLTVEAQGYYYTILGFVAFIQLADFGLAYSVMQSASHETLGLSSAANPTAAAHAARRRLSALMRGATLFNALASLFAVGLIAVAGTAVLSSGDARGQGSGTAWTGPWALALALAGGCQLLSPRIAVLEGAGQAAGVWRLRLQQELLAAGALWTTLALGLGLWSIAASWFARLVMGCWWVWGARRLLGPTDERGELSTRAYWWAEVWPFQWRIGLSSLAGFLIFQIFTPIIFSVRGPEAAAQFGMTLAIVNGLLSVSTAWLNSQAPTYGRLIAERSYDQLDRAFARALKSSLVVVVALGTAVVLGVVTLDRAGHPFRVRLLPVIPFLILVASAVVNHFITGLAVFLRAHRREPLMWPTLLGAVLTPLCLYLTGRYSTVEWVAGSYLLLTLLGAAIAVFIFLSRTREWRAAGLVPSPSNDADPV